MKKEIRSSLLLSMAIAIAMGTGAGLAAEASGLTRTQWLNKIGDSVQNEQVLRATLKQVPSENKVEFMQRSVKATTRMPVKPEERAAAFIRTVAACIASETGDTKYKLIAEAFAGVPVEYLPVVTEHLGKGFAQELNAMSDAQYQACVGTILKLGFARNVQTDEPAVRDTFAVLGLMRRADSPDSLGKLLALLPDDRTRALAASWVPPAVNNGNYDAMLAAADVEPLTASAADVTRLVGNSAAGVGSGLAAPVSVTMLTREQWLSKMGDAVKDAKLLSETLRGVPSTSKADFVQQAMKTIAAMPGTQEEKAAAYIRTIVACIASEGGQAKNKMIAEAFAVVPIEYLPVVTEHLGQRFAQEFNQIPDQQYKVIVANILSVVFERNKQTDKPSVRDSFAILAFMRGEKLDLMPLELLSSDARAEVTASVTTAQSSTGGTAALVTAAGGEPLTGLNSTTVAQQLQGNSTEGSLVTGPQTTTGGTPTEGTTAAGTTTGGTPAEGTTTGGTDAAGTTTGGADAGGADAGGTGPGAGGAGSGGGGPTIPEIPVSVDTGGYQNQGTSIFVPRR